MENIDQIIEALLFATPEPLTQKKINFIFENDSPNLDEIIERLSQQYAAQGNAFEIQNIAGGFQLRTLPDYDMYVRRLLNKTGQLHFSQAALEYDENAFGCYGGEPRQTFAEGAQCPRCATSCAKVAAHSVAL